MWLFNNSNQMRLIEAGENEAIEAAPLKARTVLMRMDSDQDRDDDDPMAPTETSAPPLQWSIGVSDHPAEAAAMILKQIVSRIDGLEWCSCR